MKLKNLIVSSLMVAVGLALASKASANELSAQSLTLSDPRPNVASTYSFAFTHTSSSTIRKFTFDFCQDPSSDSGATVCDDPITTGNMATPTLNSVSANLGVIGDWGVTVNSKVITVRQSTAAVTVNATTPLTLQLGGITNSLLTEDCDEDLNNAENDTCFVWIKSYNDSDVVVDTGVVTYTIVQEVQVTAKVDPTFTFVVAGIGANTATNGVTTSVASTSTTLPFGSLVPGTPKYAAHALYVTTNTGSGYSVTTTLTDDLTGIDTDNNIDPFPAAWSAPTTWTQPTGTVPNTNTGWIAANTNDTDVPNWGSGSGLFGGLSASAITVGEKANSDNGTTPMLVTYALGVNVFQPSDYYTGILFYNALPRY